MLKSIGKRKKKIPFYILQNNEKKQNWAKMCEERERLGYNKVLAMTKNNKYSKINREEDMLSITGMERRKQSKGTKILNNGGKLQSDNAYDNACDMDCVPLRNTPCASERVVVDLDVNLGGHKIGSSGTGVVDDNKATANGGAARIIQIGVGESNGNGGKINPTSTNRQQPQVVTLPFPRTNKRGISKKNAPCQAKKSALERMGMEFGDVRKLSVPGKVTKRGAPKVGQLRKVNYGLTRKQFLIGRVLRSIIFSPTLFPVTLRNIPLNRAKQLILAFRGETIKYVKAMLKCSTTVREEQSQESDVPVNETFQGAFSIREQPLQHDQQQMMLYRDTFINNLRSTLNERKMFEKLGNLVFKLFRVPILFNKHFQDNLVTVDAGNYQIQNYNSWEEYIDEILVPVQERMDEFIDNFVAGGNMEMVLRSFNEQISEINALTQHFVSNIAGIKELVKLDIASAQNNQRNNLQQRIDNLENRQVLGVIPLPIPSLTIPTPQPPTPIVTPQSSSITGQSSAGSSTNV